MKKIDFSRAMRDEDYYLTLSDAEWASYWASLTFELPAPQPADSTR